MLRRWHALPWKADDRGGERPEHSQKAVLSQGDLLAQHHRAFADSTEILFDVLAPHFSRDAHGVAAAVGEVEPEDHRHHLAADVAQLEPIEAVVGPARVAFLGSQLLIGSLSLALLSGGHLELVGFGVVIAGGGVAMASAGILNSAMASSCLGGKASSDQQVVAG